MRLYLIRGEWWVGYLAPNGRLHLLRKVAKQGQVVMP